MGRSVIVVGGGISGLAAAARLADCGCKVTLLEAKNRFGGRILTRQSAGNIVELGAEFVHGKNESMDAVLREARLNAAPVSEKNQLFANGNLREVDLWSRAGEVISKVDPRHPDEAFAYFLAKQAFDAETKQIAHGFVEGFNASDARKIGAHSLLRAEFSAGAEAEKQIRLVEGYQSLVDHLVGKARNRGATLILNSPVQSVEWKHGAVLIAEFRADAAVITLPLGVLKSGIVNFSPALQHKSDAIEGLQFGNVIKLIYVFERAWWPEKNFGFIHNFNAAIPTWWSDSRGPVIVGWVAGPKADALQNRSHEKLRANGLEILNEIFGKIEEPVDFQFHDWRRDGNIQGAYSYIPVNGLDLPKLLAVPVEDTLFFAGEATAMDAQMGTVSGALESGLRTAREVLRLPT
jgi:monoamine oxidase